MKTPDYTDFKARNEKEVAKPKLQPMPSIRWWQAPEELMPAQIMGHVASIIQADRGRIDGYNTYGKLYGSYTPTFWNGYQLASSGRPAAPVRDRLTYNIVQSCIDSLVSMLIQNKPKPMFLTSAGDSNIQRRAKKLDAFCYGSFYQNNIYTLGPKVFRDAAVFGEGIVHVYSDHGKIQFERVLPYEILVDYLESHYGPESTRSMHRIKNIDRTELAEMFPEHTAAIMSMSGTSTFISANQRSVADTVTVIESWRLPTGSKTGVHTITSENTLLLCEEYEEDFFPFAIMRYCPRLYGFYGQGMAEQLVPLQVEINRTLISIQRSLYMGGTHKIFVQNGSKIIKSHIDNAVGTILEYAGNTPPQYVVPQLVQPEIYNHLESMIAKGYQLPGVSQMGATSVKTPGVNSGRAMRTEQNINTQRHQNVSQMYEDFYVQLSKLVVAAARKAYLKKDTIEVKVPGKRFIETINWKEVNLEDDEFVLQIYPVSKLPNDPEGRLQSVQEMMQAGLIDPQVGRRLLDYPDLEAEENLANASLDYLHSILDDIVDHGKYKAPESDDDLQTAKKLALEYIARGKLNNLAEDRLELLRTFNVQVDAFLAPPAPALPLPGAAPMANPQATPQSELLPNVNQPSNLGQ